MGEPSFERAAWMSQQFDGYIKYLMFDAGVAFCMTRMRAEWIDRETAQKRINAYAMNWDNLNHGHYRMSSDKLQEIFEIFWAVHQIFRGRGGNLTYDYGMRGHFMIALLGRDDDPFVLEVIRRVKEQFDIYASRIVDVVMALRDSCHRLGFRLHIKKPDVYPFSASYDSSMLERSFSYIPYQSEDAIDFDYPVENPFYKMDENTCPKCTEKKVLHVHGTVRCVGCGSFVTLDATPEET
jgi:hypothetical protein